MERKPHITRYHSQRTGETVEYRYPPRVSIDEICRAALARGPLTYHRTTRAGGVPHWKFGRRLFRMDTVQRLLDAGEAVRQGLQVVRAS